MHDEKDHSMQQLRHRNCASIRPESVSASNHSPNEADGSKATGRASRVRGLIESSTCLQADEDLAFLRRPEMCGIRLQLDYWKTEESLQRHAIGHTIVVYGSTRIPAPATARRRVRLAQRMLREQPDRTEGQHALRAAMHQLERSRYYEVARELGLRSSQGLRMVK